MSEATKVELVRHLREIEVSKVTGLSRSTLQKMRLRGDGPPFLRLGATIVYREDDLADWLESKPRQRSTSDAR